MCSRVIDAHREIGPLSATFAVTVALDKAARHGAGFVGVINTQRYGILAAWSEEIARHGLLGIAANTSRAEAAVAGGRTPVLGVNPVSFALPTLGEPLSADMSTTLAPMGVCGSAGEPLPAGCFVDADGRLTDDPDRAVSAVVFGEHRGFVISLLLQALTGSMFGFPMGSEVTDTWTTGYTFIALDPTYANPDGQVAAANSRLVGQLRAARDTEGGALRLPGEHARAAALAAGTVELSEQCRWPHVPSPRCPSHAADGSRPRSPRRTTASRDQSPGPAATATTSARSAPTWKRSPGYCTPGSRLPTSWSNCYRRCSGSNTRPATPPTCAWPAA